MKGNILKFILIASIALNLSLLGTAAYKYHKQSGYWVSPFGYKMKKDSFMFEKLDLRAEQRKALREQSIPFRAEIDEKRMKIAHKRKELFDLMRADSPDKKAIGSSISEISTMQEEMQRRITGHMIEVKASLSRDQQKRFLDLIESAMKQDGQIGCPHPE